jgi:hypothetical protein
MYLPESPRTWGLSVAFAGLFVASLLPIWVTWSHGLDRVYSLTPLWALALDGHPNLLACWDATEAAVIFALGCLAGRLAHRSLAPYLRDPPAP